MTFDDILVEHVGEFGLYQKRIFVLTCLVSMASAFLDLQTVFILATPEYRCRVPGLLNDTFQTQSSYHEKLINLSIPLEVRELGSPRLSECTIYDRDNISANHLDDWEESSPDRKKIKCNDWVFDESVYVTAIVDYQMICDNTILQSHVKMIGFIGGLIGSFLFGVLSDLYGRRNIYLICHGVALAATVVVISAPPIFELFMALKLLQGLFGVGAYMTIFVYAMEFVGPRYRIFVGICQGISWAIGLFILVGMAYLIRNWIHLTIALAAPTSFFLTFFWLIPESPRWLMSRGRVSEAEQILIHVARINGTQLPDSLAKIVMDNKDNEQAEQMKIKDSGKVWKLFVHPTLLIRTVIIVFNRFALNIAYYGISLNVEHLSGDLYLNFTLSSFVELLAVSGTLLLIDRLGRKSLYCGSMILGAIGFLTSVLPIFFAGESDMIWSVVLTMVGKFGVSAAYSVMYVFGSELYPTCLRNSATGFSFLIEQQGGVICPYLVDASYLIGEKAGMAFPMLVFGGVTLVAGLFSLLLPETRNKQLPETVEDAIKFGREEVH